MLYIFPFIHFFLFFLFFPRIWRILRAPGTGCPLGPLPIVSVFIFVCFFGIWRESAARFQSHENASCGPLSQHSFNLFLLSLNPQLDWGFYSTYTYVQKEKCKMDAFFRFSFFLLLALCATVVFVCLFVCLLSFFRFFGIEKFLSPWRSFPYNTPPLLSSSSKKEN